MSRQQVLGNMFSLYRARVLSGMAHEPWIFSTHYRSVTRMRSDSGGIREIWGIEGAGVSEK